MQFQFPGFPPQTRQFLSDLAQNNNREWFQAHKADYETHLREPLLELVAEVGTALNEHVSGYAFEPRRAVYRMHRDVRFAKNKDPYKTQAAALFAPLGLKRHAGAGFYFHFSTEEMLVGGGVYAPGSAELKKIRQQIADDPEELRKILFSPGFRARYAKLDGETLKRVPRGYPKDHPAADLLVRKQFLAGTKLVPEAIEVPKISEVIYWYFRSIAPLLEYLNRPLR